MQIGIEHLRIAFVSCLSYQSTLSNGSGPRKEKEVENRYPDSLFVRIPLSTVLSPNLLFSPLFRLKRMHGICRWLGFLLHVLQPIQSTCTASCSIVMVSEQTWGISSTSIKLLFTNPPFSHTPFSYCDPVAYALRILPTQPSILAPVLFDLYQSH